MLQLQLQAAKTSLCINSFSYELDQHVRYFQTALIQPELCFNHTEKHKLTFIIFIINLTCTRGPVHWPWCYHPEFIRPPFPIKLSFFFFLYIITVNVHWCLLLMYPAATVNHVPNL